MKHVFTDPSTVAHLWANQEQEDARTGNGNFYFQNNTIYSYGSHFPIAKHVNFEGKKAILFTTREYSASTSVHIGIAAYASNHISKIYCKDPTCGSFHEENLKNFIYRIEEQAKKLTNARKPELYILPIHQITAQAKEYLEYFNFPISEVMQSAFDITDKGKYFEYAQAKDEMLTRELKRRKKEQKKLFTISLKKWLTGEKDRMYDRIDQDYLRIHNGRIQTSQNVELPIELGKRLYQQILSDTLKENDTVLSYRVIKTGSEYVIGCHSFPRKYLLKFGSSL